MKEFIFFIVAILFAIFGIVSMEPEQTGLGEFEQFKVKYGKSYANVAVEDYRRSIFLMNLAKINLHNSDSTKTYKMAVNHFADLTQEEFAETFLQAKLNSQFSQDFKKRTYATPEKLGDVNWVSQGVVSKVKNQGMCGSCWAFSATGAIESQYMLKGQNVLLSEQQLVDCSQSYGNQGCNGGWMDSAFQYTKDHGLQTEDEYPYVGKNQNCGAATGGRYKVSSYIDVQGCSNMENALSSQPISVAVDALFWSFYKSGVYSDCGTDVNHGVLLVGVNNSNNYWLIKNSWGSDWGENGFMRLKKGNTCAICNYPSYPTF